MPLAPICHLTWEAKLPFSTVSSDKRAPYPSVHLHSLHKAQLQAQVNGSYKKAVESPSARVMSKNMGSRIRLIWVCVQSPLVDCMALDMFLNLFESQFSHLQNRYINSSYFVWLSELNYTIQEKHL